VGHNARIVGELGDSAMIKGGLVVGLRVERARTTKDSDLRLNGSGNWVETRRRTKSAQVRTG
jgi:hypothetical protein